MSAQTVFRNVRRTHFTTLPNELINDERLKDRQMALLVFLLSKPADWRITIAALEQGGRFGAHDKLIATTKALRDLGYMRLRRFADGTTEWSVTDVPGAFGDEEPHSGNPNEGEQPHSEKPNSEKPTGIQKTEVLQKTDKQTLPPVGPPSQPTNRSAPQRGARLDDHPEWETGPPQWLAWAQQTRPDLDAGACWLEFWNYWTALPGTKARKLDWQKTWQNNILNKRRSYVDGRPRARAINWHDPNW